MFGIIAPVNWPVKTARALDDIEAVRDQLPAMLLAKMALLPSECLVLKAGSNLLFDGLSPSRNSAHAYTQTFCEQLIAPKDRLSRRLVHYIKLRQSWLVLAFF
jgi:hypothetical protein